MVTPPIEVPQPMKVAGQSEAASTAENQTVEEPQAFRFTWAIENFSRQTNKKIYSGDFVVGGFLWRVLVFPKGNNVDQLSMYLDVVDSSSLPNGWSRYAKFNFSVVNQINNRLTVSKYTRHQFNAKESDWGFTSFMPLGDLYHPSKGFIVNDTCIIEATVAVKKVVDNQKIRTAKISTAKSTVIASPQTHTVVGLNTIRTGEGEKDTLNRQKGSNMADLDTNGSNDSSSSASVRAKMRKIVHDVDKDDDALHCHDSDISKGADENTKCEDLQLEYVKPVINDVNGSVMIPSDVVNAGSLPYSRTLYGFLFEGNEIDFSLVDSHIRKMWGKHGIEDVMMNDNGFYYFKFKTDKGMLDALEHGPWSIINIPIFLKRWTPGLILDKSKDDKVKLPVWVKIYNMPLELWNKKGLNIISSMVGNPLAVDSATAKMCMNASGRAGYARVLVDVDATGNWVDKVSVSIPFGNENLLSTLRIEYSWKPAKCSLCKVFAHTDSNCKIRSNKEEEEREIKRRYMAQPHLYTVIKVARDNDLLEQIGKDIYFDLVDHDKVRTFYIKKQTPFNLFKEEVAKEFGVPVQFQRFWIWGTRQNSTYRPDRPLTAQEETQSVEELRKIQKHSAELKLFLEIELGGPDLHPIPPPDKSKDDILLFFKLYDPEKEELRYVGSFFVKSRGKPTEIISKLNRKAGFSADEEIELYEEIFSEPIVTCERLDKSSTFRSSQIQDGDIFCFQKLSQAQSGDKYRYPDVPSFLEYVKNR